MQEVARGPVADGWGGVARAGGSNDEACLPGGSTAHASTPLHQLHQSEPVRTYDGYASNRRSQCIMQHVQRMF